jgi:hypothetical protein
MAVAFVAAFLGRPPLTDRIKEFIAVSIRSHGYLLFGDKNAGMRTGVLFASVRDVLFRFGARLTVLSLKIRLLVLPLRADLPGSCTLPNRIFRTVAYRKLLSAE